MDNEIKKLSIERISEGDITCVRLVGVLDESFEGKRTASSIKASTAILDMGEVQKISSFGIREWSHFISQLARNVDNIYLLDCTPKVMDQVNMVAGFTGGANILSFYGPYRCDYCDVDKDVAFQVGRDQAAIRSFDPPEHLCEICTRPLFFDEDPASYFSTIVQQPEFDIAPGVTEFMSAKLHYDLAGGNRGLQIDKHVEGKYTYVRLVGNLDGSFPSEKIAEGLEGEVVVDVNMVGSVEIAGAAEWRNFITLSRAGASRIYVINCSPILLDRLPNAEDVGDEIISLTLPYSCTNCGTTTSECIEVADHYDILKFATPPELKCRECKQPTACVAPESILSRLRNIPQPAADSKLKNFVKSAQKLRFEKATVDGDARGGGGVSRTLVAASLGGVLAAAGVLIFFVTRQNETQEQLEATSQRLRELVDRKETKPAWITSDERFQGYCSDRVSSMVCVGISEYQPDKDAATDEARNVVLNSVVENLAVKFANESFERDVQPLYSDSRVAISNAYSDVADKNGLARDEAYQALSDARRRTALALMNSAGPSIPSQYSELYWEKYEDQGKVEFLAFVRYDINSDQLKRLGEIFTQPRDIAGGKAMTAFPLLAYSYPDFEGGTLVVEPEGKLSDFDKSDVVVSVGGEQVFTLVKFEQALAKGSGQVEVAERKKTL